MKNDVSHHGILSNLIFVNFCWIFPEKTRFRIRKTEYPIQKLICFKTFKLNWSNNTLKTGFSRISGKTASQIQNFFGLKPPCDQGANKKKFSQIGPAIPKEIGRKHTRTQASKHLFAIYKGIYISILGF